MMGDIDNAYSRVLIIKNLLAMEKIRAMRDASDKRNVDLGLVDADSTKKEATNQLIRRLADLENMLEYLHISHIAAAFEAEAKSKISNRIGESRLSIESARKPKSGWTSKLVRNLKSFDGLYEIEQTIGLAGPRKIDFDEIRRIRNIFDHSVDMSSTVNVDALTARALCLAMLLALD